MQIKVETVEAARRHQRQQQVQPTGKFMEEQTKRKKDAAAEKARTALKARMEDSQKKRRVCLAIEASPPPEPAPLAE